MVTHILIPIKEFKKQIKATKGHLEHHELKHWLKNSKHISLDEKDIRQKAHEFQATLPDLTVYHHEAFVGYEQALKDLK